MILTNHLDLPESLVEAVRNDAYSPGESDITVTQLIGPPRIRILRKRHRHEITEDVSERLWSLYGQSVHHILDRAADNELTESRLYATVNGWKIGGQFDNLRLKDGRLSDYKMTSIYAVKNGPKPEWEAQLNVLAYLALHNRLNVSELEIVALLKDWRRGESRSNKDYPEVPAKRVPVEMWEGHSRYFYILGRVEAHQFAERSGPLPDCTDAERWATEPCVAVMKKGNKKATKLFYGDDTVKKAADFIDAHKDGKKMTAEPRPRTYNRCEGNYCSVAPYCDQWQRQQEAA